MLQHKFTPEKDTKHKKTPRDGAILVRVRWVHKLQGGTKKTIQTPQDRQETEPPVESGRVGAEARATEEGIEREGFSERRTTSV